MRSLARAKIKRVKAVDLLAQGLSYDEIARQVGFSNRGSAHRAVMKALTEREVEDVDKLRAMEAARLDALQAAHWEDAMAGDVAASRIVLRIIDARVRLLGLSASVPSYAEIRPRTLVLGTEGNPGGATAQLAPANPRPA